MARDMLYDRLFRHAMRIPEAFDNWERIFRNIPIYNVTNAVPLLQGLDTKGIPKRLPHLNMWMEWSFEPISPDDSLSLGDKQITTGVWISGIEYNPAENPGWLSNEKASVVYRMIMFIKTYSQEAPVVDPAVYWVALLEDQATVASVEPDAFNYEDSLQFSRELLHTPILAGLTADDRNPENMRRYFLSPWTVIRVAALLNCRNVTTEVVEQNKLQPRVNGEREHRPCCSYKILKLEVPRRTTERNGDPTEGDDGPKQRFHICRGHYKHLKDARYKNPGWYWWPDHWRGSIGLGRADKSYALVPAKPAEVPVG